MRYKETVFLFLCLVVLGMCAWMDRAYHYKGRPDDSNTAHQIPLNNSSFTAALQTFLGTEQPTRDTERGFPNCVDTGYDSIANACLGTTGAGLTMALGACTAYNAGYRSTCGVGNNLGLGPNGVVPASSTADCPGGNSITFPDNSTCWVAMDENTVGNNGAIPTFTRVTGTHYLTDCTSVMPPAMAVDSQLLMHVTTIGGSITAVSDDRQTACVPTPIPTAAPPGTSFPIMSYGGECNVNAPQPYAPTTANTIGSNSTVTMASLAGFIVGGGIRLKHAGAVNLSGTSATPTVTAVTLVANENHTISTGSGVQTFATSGNWVEDYALRLNQSGTSLWRLNTGVSPGISQYYVTPPASPPGTATYTVQSNNLTTPLGVLNARYWTPDSGDATSYCYKNRFIDAEDGVQKSSAGACTSTGAATLGPTAAVVDNYGTPPGGAVGVCIYRSTDGGNTYALYWAQPLSDTNTTSAAPQTNDYVDEGGAIGRFFSPPITDNNCPSTPDATNYADDLITTITAINVPNSTMTLTVAPTQTLTGTMAMTDDTNALIAAWTAAAATGAGIVDIPSACRIDFANATNYPGLFGVTGATGPAGVTLRGTTSFITGLGANLYIDGTGNGACSMTSNQSGALAMYYNTNAKNLRLGCNDNGSTNYVLGCLFNYGNVTANGAGVLDEVGMGGGGGVSFGKPTCPNVTGAVLAGADFTLDKPYFALMRHAITAAGNGVVVRGTGDLGFPFAMKEYVVQFLGGQPVLFQGVSMEDGPDFLRILGSSGAGTGHIDAGYMADAPSVTQCTTTYDCGDDIPIEVGTRANGQGDPNIEITNMLIEGGVTGMVVMSAGTRVLGDHFYGLSGSQTAILVQDGFFGNFSNNEIGYNIVEGAGYATSFAIDDATLGMNTWMPNFVQSAYNGTKYLDLTNATDSGEIWYDESIDNSAPCAGCYITSSGLATGILDTNNTIPKWHHLHAFANNSASSDALQTVKLGGTLYDNPVTCNESSGGGCVFNLGTGRSQIVNIADNTAFAIGCTGAPLKVGQQWELTIHANSGITPGAITLSSCFAPDSTFPATNHPAAGKTVLCAAMVSGSNQSQVGPCSGDIAVVATPTPTPTPTPSPVPTATPTIMPTPTPLPT